MLLIKKKNYFQFIKIMRHIFTIIIFSFVFGQFRLSIDTNGKFDNKDIESGILLSYDKILYKQDNIKTGLGIEYMFPIDSKDLTYTDFSFNSIYMFLRFSYEKKWSSYLRLGFNVLDSNQLSSDGIAIAFGADYKLNDNWHLETGYHIYSIDDSSYSKSVFSIVRHFKKKDDN